MAHEIQSETETEIKTEMKTETETKIETRGKTVVTPRKREDGKGLLDYYDVHSSKIYQIRVK